MSAIKISIINGNVELKYEEKTRANITKRLMELKKSLNVTWEELAVVFGLKPTEYSMRLLKRWTRDPKLSSFQEMSENQWKFLLVLVQGQKKLNSNENSNETST